MRGERGNIMCNSENGKKGSDTLKGLFVIVGAIVTIGAVLAVLYGLFKKYFKVTFEYDTDSCDDCFDDDCDNCEPVCYCNDQQDEDSDDDE